MNRPNRKQQRLKGYDYSNNGYYFITICIKDKNEIFGKVVSGKMTLSNPGKVVEETLTDLPNHYKNCEIDCHVIMPDHVHAVIIVDNTDDKEKKKHGLSEIIRGFKTFSSRRINELRAENKKFHWQKSFHDRIVRNEKELFNIRKYIEQNPLKYELDKGMPENTGL